MIVSKYVLNGVTGCNYPVVSHLELLVFCQQAVVMPADAIHLSL